MNAKLCFYEEGSTSIVDTVKNGTDRSFYGNKTLEEIRWEVLPNVCKN